MRKNGFTYIELLITLAIIAVLFVPMMQLFSHSLNSTVVSQNLITATNLAKWEMEKIKNLNVTELQLQEIGDTLYPPLKEEPLEMNNVKWRIKREIVAGSKPLQVSVKVYREGEPREVVVRLVTLIGDRSWEEVIPVE